MIKDSKQRLFEMMNRVGGMPIKENVFESPRIQESGELSDLPPGFSSQDFIPLKTDIELTPCRIGTNEDVEVVDGTVDEDMIDKVKTGEVDPKILQPEFKKKLASYLRGEKQGIGGAGRIHSGTLKDVMVDLNNVVDRKTGEYIDPTKLTGKNRKYYDVQDEDIPDFDLNKLKKILMTVPNEEQLLGKNQKMAKSNFYNISLPALKSLIYHKNTNKFYVITTCSKAKECIAWCYAQMGNYVQYDAPIRLKMQKLNYLINHWDEWKNRVIARIEHVNKYKKRDTETVVRWHDSGDFISPDYLEIAFDIARATPNVYHYAYTKEVSMVKGANVPPNFEFKFSLEGHERKEITPEDPTGVVAPEDLFKEFWKEKPEGVDDKTWKASGMWNFTPEEKNIVRDRIARHYGIKDPNQILWHDDYIKIPHDRTQEHERKWYVIGKPGDTDIPASRKDTMGIINLLHK